MEPLIEVIQIFEYKDNLQLDLHTPEAVETLNWYLDSGIESLRASNLSTSIWKNLLSLD